MTETPIQIRNPDVVRDIRALADRLGLPLTEAVADAVRRRLAQEEAGAQAAHSQRMQRVSAVLAAIDSLPHLGPALGDAELYDSEGFAR